MGDYYNRTILQRRYQLELTDGAARVDVEMPETGRSVVSGMPSPALTIELWRL
jgi:hypothetical protein